MRTVVPAPRRYHDVDGGRAQAMGLVSRAIKRVGPAVVRLETETYSDEHGGVGQGGKLEGKGEQQQQQRDDDTALNGDPANDDEGRGDIFDGVPGAPPPPADDRAGGHVDFGQGSGIIINGEGYILTNAHVVEGATRVYVLLTDGRRFKAEMRGSDDIVDVAVLKIVPEFDGTDESDDHRQLMASLPVAELGDSDLMEVGNFVTAIGSPGGLDNTCTIGIVSGLKRCPKVVGIPDKFGVLDYIQTDAASEFMVLCSFYLPSRVVCSPISHLTVSLSVIQSIREIAVVPSSTSKAGISWASTHAFGPIWRVPALPYPSTRSWGLSMTYPKASA